MNNLENVNLEVLAKFVQSDEGDHQIASFIDELVERAGSKEKYESLCKEADRIDFKDGCKKLENLFDNFLDIFWPYVVVSPTGHGLSHLIQDALVAMAIHEDDIDIFDNNEIVYVSDYWAGLIGGVLHDLGNAIVPRYADYQRRAGHAEVIAWRVYHLLEPYLSEPMRDLLGYVIAAHTHYTKPIVIAGQGTDTNNVNGDYHRPVYWYEDFIPESGKWISVGVVMARAIDRMGTRGVIHYGRHLLATADSVQSGIVGIDHTGKEKTFQVDKDALRIHLLPELGYHEIEGRDAKTPTVLQHVLNYQRGDLGKNNNLYGRNDGYFGVYREMMVQKHTQTAKLIKAVVEKEPNMRNFNLMEAFTDIKNSLSMISRATTFNTAWETLFPLYQELDKEQIARWQNGSKVAMEEYIDWMKNLKIFANPEDNNPMKPLFKKIIPHSF